MERLNAYQLRNIYNIIQKYDNDFIHEFTNHELFKNEYVWTTYIKKLMN